MKTFFRAANRMLRKGNRGSALVLTSICIVALMSFAALSIDVGLVYVQDRYIQAAADVTALAAVRDWAAGKPASDVVALGMQYALTNGLKSAEVISITPGTWVESTKTFVAGAVAPGTIPAVQVLAQRHVPMSFGKAVGIDEMVPRVEAVAIAAAANAAAQVLPWAVCDSFIPVEGAQVQIHYTDAIGTNACENSGPLSGNYGALNLPGSRGGDWYRENIINGYQGTLRVGDIAYTEPGGSWGPTTQGLDDRIGGLPPFDWTPGEVPHNKRLGILPKVVSLDLSGRKAVTITGFYVVSLDGYEKKTKAVTVTFLRAYVGREVNPEKLEQPGALNAIGLVR